MDMRNAPAWWHHVITRGLVLMIERAEQLQGKDGAAELIMAGMAMLSGVAVGALGRSRALEMLATQYVVGRGRTRPADTALRAYQPRFCSRR